jgi:ribonucleoside-diphosphate reductase alpha chain
MFGDAPLPDSFVSAHELSADEHLAVQAAAQTFVDGAISKTINCRPDLPFADFEDIYLRAYHLGCKGCTTFRANGVTGEVVTPATDEEESPEPSLPQSQEWEPECLSCL